VRWLSDASPGLKELFIIRAKKGTKKTQLISKIKLQASTSKPIYGENKYVW